jgi:hypothetical protein
MSNSRNPARSTACAITAGILFCATRRLRSREVLHLTDQAEGMPGLALGDRIPVPAIFRVT